MTTFRNGDGRSERLWSIRNVAEYCAVSEKTVRRWIFRSQLRAHLLGRQWRVVPEDLESFLMRRSNSRRHFVP